MKTLTEDLEAVIETLQDALCDELDECGADDEPLCGRRVCDNHGCILDKLCRLRKAVVNADTQP